MHRAFRHSLKSKSRREPPLAEIPLLRRHVEGEPKIKKGVWKQLHRNGARARLGSRCDAFSVGKRHPAKSHTLFDWAIYAGLIISVLLAYAQVANFDFVRYDDQMYTYENPNVTAGLTAESVKWAFTAVTNVDYWRPISLLSHVVDAQLFGMRSGMHHLVNVFFHALAAIVLFVSFKRATNAPWLSAFVAFIFALHPLHVESVAWVTERKDVLSTLFCFLALYAYVRYAEQPRIGWYLAAAVLFGLGLMSKPMVVTFPFVLLLMDLWPLYRFQWPRSVIEKIPLLILSAGVSAITYLGQQASDQIEATPAALRLKNAFVWYLGYIGQTFWPTNLAVYYPFSVVDPGLGSRCGVRCVRGDALAAVSMWRTRPYVAVGWLWYVGTLVPVIGFVRSGYQAHADRYMYLPMVGLTIVLAWGAAEISAKWPGAKNMLVATAVVACVACLLDARAEVANWQDTSTLFEHAAASGHDSALGENNLGYYILLMGRSAGRFPILNRRSSWSRRTWMQTITSASP